MESSDAADFFGRCEAAGLGMRLDETIWPPSFRCATVCPSELAELRRVSDVVRLGRVQRIEPREIVLDQGSVPTGEDVLHVDCTADGLVRRPPCTVFDGEKITLQPLVMCQQVLSAAATAMIELKYEGDESKNALCTPVPHPAVPADYFTGILQTYANLWHWVRRFGWWLLRNRLSLLHHVSWLGVLRVMIAGARWEKRAMASFERLHDGFDAEVLRPESPWKLPPGRSEPDSLA